MVTREMIIKKALEGRMTWKQAAMVLGVTTRHLRRIRKRYEQRGRGGLGDGRSGRPRKKRIPEKMVQKLIELKRTKYSEFSVRHFYDVAVEKHGLEASYGWTLSMLQRAGVVEKTPHRGTYRRRRPRQPMVGMRLHTDGSTHPWLGASHPTRDVVIMLDDADGRLLAAHFVPEENVLSTMQLLEEVLRKHGRFGELYHDRGSMYCRTSNAKAGPDAEQAGQVSRALEALSIRQIWAYSPQARGRCERAFGTIQGRLCAELKVAGIDDYEAAEAYLQDVFIKDFNRRFTVKPAERESAFVPLAIRKRELQLLLSIQHERVVNNDYTVHYERRVLQLPKPDDKRPLRRRKVTVHELIDGQLAVTRAGKLLGVFDADEPTQRKPEERRYQPKPTPPDLPQRGGLNFLDDDFWDALTRDHDRSVVSRNDMFSTNY